MSRYFKWLTSILIIVAVVFGLRDNTWSYSGLTYTYGDFFDNQDPNVSALSVIGYPSKHTVKKRDTLLDIARNYGLGFNEMENLYPDLDPWLLKAETELMIPTMWVLPQEGSSKIVINLAEMRLYHFIDGQDYIKKIWKRPSAMVEKSMIDTKFVRTYPVGIGDEKYASPLGSFRVVDKIAQPVWYIPPSLQKKYAPHRIFPPGPDNPLGDYFIGIGHGYGIHGTNNPWSVGRLVTHGCIRLYPEDIEMLFPSVFVGMPVEILYEPVKIGIRNRKIYAEVHPDIYSRISDFYQYGMQRLSDSGLKNFVDMDRFEAEIARKSGIPIEVGVK